MNQLSEHDQLVNAKLEKMKADGWQEIRSMTWQQQDEFLDELNATSRMYYDDNPFVHLRAEAVKAINDVRRERSRAASDRWFKLQTREQSIAGAAQKVREAIELVEGASAIPDYSDKPPAPPSLDVSTATDDELYVTLTECLQIVRAEKDHYADDAQAIALLKTPSSKAISAELKARAQAYADRRAKADELVQAITAERERRAAERAKQAEEMTVEALHARIAALEAAQGKEV